MPLDRAAISIGRNSDVDLRFDPAVELDVSGRHALFARTAAGAWTVRDLGSTNGTFVNGIRITGDVKLKTGDRVMFGEAGPAVEFRTDVGAGFSGAPAASHLAESPATATVPIDRRLRHAVAGTPARRALAGISLLLLGVIAAISVYAAGSRSAILEGERALLQQRIDSLTVAGQQSIQSLRGEIEELSDALRVSQEEVQAATLRLEQAQRRGNAIEVAALRDQLDSATAIHGQRQAAAGLDFLEIQRINRPAVAVIYVENENGRVSTGTAFAVRPDATMVTSRHVLTGEGGSERPRRIAIQFADSEQVWPARILRVAADADLAIVKVDNILGSVPTVQSLNLRPDTLSAGSVVASIGFPVARGLSPEATYNRGGVVEPLLSAGIVGAVTSDRMEFQGYGAAGASGSPVFDAAGTVIAVLFGGLTGSAHPTLVGVPATSVAALLQALP
jgi:S1-C subfamily serine protease